MSLLIINAIQGLIYEYHTWLLEALGFDQLVKKLTTDARILSLCEHGIVASGDLVPIFAEEWTAFDKFIDFTNGRVSIQLDAKLIKPQYFMFLRRLRERAVDDKYRKKWNWGSLKDLRQREIVYSLFEDPDFWPEIRQSSY